MIVLDLSILNQKGTPMFNSDIFANRPNFGIVGRIFISTDTSEIYRDTGTSWVLIADTSSGGTITGSGTTGTIPIWSGSTSLGNSSLIEAATLISTTKDIQADGYYLTGATLGTGALYFYSSSNRVTLANYNAGGIVHIEVNGGLNSTIFGTDLSLTNNGYISAVPTLTAANNASSVAIVGVNTLSYAASFSANNIGSVYGGIAVYNLQTFAGSATFANANVASGGSSVNSIDFSSGGSTITMTQSSGIRVMSGQQNLFQYQGTNSGTITHAAISQNTGFYRPTAATGILTITNAYSHLINALDDYGAGFTFTNRWGIYQAGASDLNYFAASVLIGSNVNSGFKLDVSGTARLGALTGTSAVFSGTVFNGGLLTTAYESLGSSMGTYIRNNSASTINNSADIYFGTWGGSTIAGITNARISAINVNAGNAATDLLFYTYNGSSSGLRFRIASTGAATFSNKVITGGGTDTGQELQINGTIRINGQSSATSSGNSGQHLIINLDGTQYKIKLENN